MAIRPVRLAVTVTRECRSESVYLDGRILVGVKVPGASTKSHDSPTAANQGADRILCPAILGSMCEECRLLQKQRRSTAYRVQVRAGVQIAVLDMCRGLVVGILP